LQGDCGVLKIEPANPPDDANFVFDLGADSMQSIMLVAGFRGVRD
jgi:acyl carrier protein